MTYIKHKFIIVISLHPQVIRYPLIAEERPCLMKRKGSIVKHFNGTDQSSKHAVLEAGKVGIIHSIAGLEQV
jgi:hypothetical protein